MAPLNSSTVTVNGERLECLVCSKPHFIHRALHWIGWRDPIDVAVCASCGHLHMFAGIALVWGA
jgi:hypothetical protein